VDHPGRLLVAALTLAVLVPAGAAASNLVIGR
jgi:hypothetical protein